MPQAISYIRFSSGSQAKGTSTARQEEMVTRWLVDNPEYRLNKGLSKHDAAISGYSGDHLKEGTGLHAIQKAISNGLISKGDVLLVEAMDRLGRLEPTSMVKLFLSILDAGIDIITLEDQQQYSIDLVNQNHSLLFIFVGKIQQAYDYSNRLSRRIKSAWDFKRQAAREGKEVKKVNPFWLDNHGKLKEPQATLARNIIDMYLAGKGYRAIEIEIEGQYSFKTLKRLLHNPALIGHWVTNDKGSIIENVYEPLITVQKYRELQYVLKQREKTQAPPSKNLLSGLMICGECGSKLNIRVQKHETSPILYCNCSKYLKNGGCSNNTTYDYSIALELLKETFASFLTWRSETWLEETNNNDEEAELRQRKDKLTQDIATLLALAKATGDIEQLSIELITLNTELNSLNNKLAKIAQEQMDEEDVFEYTYSSAASLYEEPVKLNAILRNSDYQIVCNNNLLWVNTSEGQTIYCKMIKRVGIPAIYLTHFYEIDEFLGDFKISLHYKAINRFNVFTNDNFVNLVREVKGNQADRWFASVARKEFPELLEK